MGSPSIIPCMRQMAQKKQTRGGEAKLINRMPPTCQEKRRLAATREQ